MHIVITYDICSTKTRNLVFKVLKEYGINTQRSVFECRLDQQRLEELKKFLLKTLDPNTDKFLILALCKKCIKQSNSLGNGFKNYNINFEVI